MQLKKQTTDTSVDGVGPRVPHLFHCNSRRYHRRVVQDRNLDTDVAEISDRQAPSAKGS